MNGLNKRNLIIGIGFLILAILCIIGIINNGVQSYYITGTLLFTIIGIAFVKRAKSF